MKKFILLIILLLIPTIVKGYYLCDYTDYRGALKKAQNVNLMIEYEIIDNEPLFTITIYNILKTQTIVNETNQIEYDYSDTDNGVLIIKNITEAGMYKFSVYSSENNCNTNSLATMYAEIPSFNAFYSDDVCNGIENYKLCQRWSTVNITYEEFLEKVAEYKASLKSSVSETEYQTLGEYILEFYFKYYYYILPAIIVIGGTLIIVLKSKENKFGI